MRRLISMLAAGLLAGGTILTAAGAASAGTTAARQAGCTEPISFHVTKSHTDYYLGASRNLSPGAVAFLKPKRNATTAWYECAIDGSDNSVALENVGGLALTSRATSSGANVILEPPGNSGNGFASQRWIENAAGPMITLQNVKTGLFLRVRNSGPVMGQTVTTGSTFTVWLLF